MLTVLSLFSGAGGLDLGFAQTGYMILFANDKSQNAVLTYAKNFRMEVTTCGPVEYGAVMQCDVAKVDFRNLRGEVDVVIGGPPCQDFTVIRGRKRLGVESPRGQLYQHFARALAETQPLAFVFENVPGIMTSNNGQAIAEIKKALVRARYNLVFSDVLDASHFGVPQSRKRLIIIGVRDDVWRVSTVMRMNTLREARFGVLAKYPLTAMEALEGRPLDELGERYREVMEEWRGVWNEAGTPAAERWFREVWSRLTMDPVLDYLTVNKITPASEDEIKEAMRLHREVLAELGYLNKPVCSEPSPDGTCKAPRESSEVVERMRRIPPGENHRFVAGTPWGIDVLPLSLVYRRLHPLKPAYTIVGRGGGGSQGYHYERSRLSLTNRERARLQTFPDSFVFHGGQTKVSVLIGDAVPVLLAKRIAEVLMTALRL